MDNPPNTPLNPPAPVVPPTPPVPVIITPPVSPRPNFLPFIVIGGLLVLVIIGLVFYFLLKGGKQPAFSSGASQNQTKIPSKYATDSDGDGIADVLETELGLDSTVSELTRCQPGSCESSDASQALSSKNNILFIIDNSGSMGLLIDGKTKMDLAKDAIRNFLKSTAANVNIGIMIYGEKGSNSTADKATSCSGSEIIAPIGTVSTSTIDGYLAQMRPVGWTPIGLAIRDGKNAFTGKEGQKNQMIVVTDGAETCDTNPAGAASEAKSSPYQIRVDVIGFGVNASEQSSLQAISTNGGGLFSIAANADQLLSQMQASHENFEKFQSSAKCTSDVYQKSLNCLQDVQQKAFNYLNTQLASKHGAEYQELANVQSAISKVYFDKINQVQAEWDKAIKAAKQQLEQ